MGGCCSSSRKAQLHGTPVYYYCPPALREQGSVPLSHGAASTLAAGLLVDLNLEMPIPDTYRPPPAPMPFDVVLGRPQTPARAEACVGSKCDAGTVSESLKLTVNAGGFDNSSKREDKEKSNCKALADFLLDSPNNSEDELPKLVDPNIKAMDEEDVCPICLEEYDLENPEIVTKCEHHFHLSCILEWMERSGACPVCDQETILDRTRN